MLSCQQANTADQDDKQNLVPSNTEQDPIGSAPDSLQLQGLFQLSDAEKILGEKAHLKDSSLIKRDDVTIFQCSYSADAADEKAGKTGIIYFMVEHYTEIASARQVYTSIKKANEDHEGIKILEGVGDEAYFHSDNENFLFILARKGNKVLRIKVNKITSHTSVDEFNSIVGKIVGMM